MTNVTVSFNSIFVELASMALKLDAYYFIRVELFFDN